MRNLTTLGSVSALYPLLGVGERSERGGVDSVCRSGCAFQPDARNLFYVDGLICYHSCCQVLQLNLTARDHQTINIKPSTSGFWRQVVHTNERGECGLRASVSALLPPFWGFGERSFWRQRTG